MYHDFFTTLTAIHHINSTNTNDVNSLGGLGSSDVTKIKNRKIFETRKEEKISGIEKSRTKKSEIGISLTSTVALQHSGKYFHWEFYGNVFASIKKLKTIKDYTYDVNNVFMYYYFDMYGFPCGQKSVLTSGKIPMPLSKIKFHRDSI